MFKIEKVKQANDRSEYGYGVGGGGWEVERGRGRESWKNLRYKNSLNFKFSPILIFCEKTNYKNYIF